MQNERVWLNDWFGSHVIYGISGLGHSLRLDGDSESASI